MDGLRVRLSGFMKKMPVKIRGRVEVTLLCALDRSGTIIFG